MASLPYPLCHDCQADLFSGYGKDAIPSYCFLSWLYFFTLPSNQPIPFPYHPIQWQGLSPFACLPWKVRHIALLSSVISLFTNFMSQFRIGVHTFFVVKLVNIYESGIYKAIFLMAVFRKWQDFFLMTDLCLMVKILILVTNVIWQEEFALLQS